MIKDWKQCNSLLFRSMIFQRAEKAYGILEFTSRIRFALAKVSKAVPSQFKIFNAFL